MPPRGPRRNGGLALETSAEANVAMMTRNKSEYRTTKPLIERLDGDRLSAIRRNA